MYLKKIEMKGFKSFADKIEMEFGPGITAIVGPNGSGKSNIADAVRWVLGEQSAKSLRGSKMEDVIFTGTDNRKALGFAEVSITLDNKDGHLPLDYTEVMITRRVFRSGESEYYINKTGSRLKDINELFMDTGVGKEGYSIIGQGRIDEILSTKSEDRRKVFEEAAGIVKYKSRKDEAERKLEKTKDNLTRLQDIIEELNRQIEPLQEQSEKAKAYLQMKERLMELELNVFVRNIERLNRQRSQITEKIKEYQRLIYEKNNIGASLEAAFNNLSNRIRQIEDEIQKQQEKLYSDINLIEKKEGETKVLLQKVLGENESIKLHEKEINRLNQEIERMKTEKENRLSEYRELSAVLDEKKKLLDAFQENLDSISMQVGEEEGRVEELKSQIIENMNTISQLNSKADSMKAMNDSIYRRNLQIVEETQSLEGLSSALQRELKELYDKTAALKRDHSKQNEKHRRLENDLKRVRSEILALTQKKDRLSSELKSDFSRLELLKEMEREFEGYSRSVRGLMEGCRSSKELSRGIIGPVAELISVRSGMETAIEVALGPNLQNIITYDEEDAKRAIGYLKSNRLGRATFLPIASIKRRHLDKNEEKALRMKGCIGIASELVDCPENIRGVIDNLLGRVVVVDNLDSGIAMAKSFEYSFRIVTIEGDVLNPGGSISGGSSPSRETGLLHRKREIESIERRIGEKEKGLSSLKEEEKRLAEEEKEILPQIEYARDKIHRLDIERTRLEETIDARKRELEDKAGKIEEIRKEKLDLEIEYQETLNAVNEIQNKVKNYERENRIKQEQVRSLQKGSAEKKQDRENIMQQITVIKIEVAKMSQRLEDMHSSMEQSSLALQNLSLNKLEREKDIEINRNNIKKIENQIGEIKEEINGLIGEKNKGNDELVRLQQAKAGSQQRLKEKEESIKANNKEISEVEEQLHKDEVLLAKVEMELKGIHDKMWEEYEVSYIKALDYKKDIDNYRTVENEISDIKKRIKVLGSVNVDAINEYKRVKDRYDFLTQQRKDLIEAKDSLNKIIREMVETMKRQFSAQFAVIDHEFNKVFRELFGGGKAQLVLAEEDNILESGIDIIAQPPGKKLQQLSLLSGGEKSLAAIALLFAILRVKPTPFCLLDEIEAALDDANVERFGKFLRKLAGNTQFIIITHRKGTMEEADNLYGITMEEKGISKLVSIKLEDKVS
ncbi:MAG: Chromosome partition protein smc [Firmicutes bacterium]|nr:Chromosome partition protein smc [Bacillota bacterium]MDI6704640.1 chromosome segregation protein SMC [Bacillota bacterium]